MDEQRYCYHSFISSRKLIVRVLLCLTIVGLVFVPTLSYAKRTESNVFQDRYAAYVMDADSGRILYRENENKVLHPASLTKLMTLLMVFDALEHGNLKLYNRVYISQHAASMSPSKLNLPAGSTIKVKDAILALVTKSANDIAVALAEKLGGTEDKFARMMTRKARSLGMKKTRFKNASGLHHPKQVSTAKDMSLLAHAMITDYKDYYHYFSTKSFTYDGTTYRNHNKLMKSYKGMDGMKTGYIKASGFNLIASVVRDDHRLIGVVFGGRTGRSRNAHMKRLLDDSFRKIGDVYILASKAPVPKRKPQQDGSGSFDVASAVSPKVSSVAAYAPVISVSPAAPVPAKKPVSGSKQTYAYADLSTSQDYAAEKNRFSRWDMLDSSKEDSMFNRMIGEGDYDITVRNRIETGLIAISAQLRNAQKEKRKNKGNIKAHAIVPVLPDSTPPSILSSFAETGGIVLASADVTKIEPSAPVSTSNKLVQTEFEKTNLHGDWSIQIGAFTSRERTENALTTTLNMLPPSLSSAKSKIAPLKTAQGWIYRGRFEGYSKTSAKDACSLLPDCIALAPRRD